jgi:hypothetical protein
MIDYLDKLLNISFASDRKANVGTIECRMCQETYSTTIHCKLVLNFIEFYFVLIFRFK